MKKDGEFTALEADLLSDSGPYVSLTTALTSVYAVESAGAYHFPNINVRVRGLLTNNLTTTPMRGFGTQQVAFGIESIVEKAAFVSGIDPIKLRLKNFRKTKYDGKRKAIPDTSNSLQNSLEFVKAKLGSAPIIPEGWLYGRGYGTVHAKYGFPYGFIDRFKAKVSLNKEGNFIIESDIPDFGSGAPMGLSTLVADIFNLDTTAIYSQSQNAIQDPTTRLLQKGKKASGFRSGINYFLEGSA
jgi:CO/xanthine dehydrogenase Mo-binding subunit